MKKRFTASFLAFFFGTFGIHMFYIKKIDYGILYILFCWTGVPTLLGIIDSLTLLFAKKEVFHPKK